MSCVQLLPSQIIFSSTSPMSHCCEYWLLMLTAAPPLWRTVLGPSPLATEWLTWGAKEWPLCLKMGPPLWCHFYSRTSHRIKLKQSSSWDHILTFFSSSYVLLPLFSFSREHSLNKAHTLASSNPSSGFASREPDTNRWAVRKMDWSRRRVMTGKQDRRLLQQSVNQCWFFSVLFRHSITLWVGSCW